MLKQGLVQHLNDNSGRSKGIDISGKTCEADDRFEDKDDQFIWQAFKAKNESAFIYIYKRYFPDLINYGHQLTRESQLVEDCIQDLFIDLRKNRRNLTSSLASIKAYLFRALKRRIIEHRRKTKHIDENASPHKDFEIVPSAEANIIQDQAMQERLSRMHQAFGKLTDRQREALFYLYYENLSYQEIKEIMGIDHVRSVRNLVYKAVAALKTIVKFLVLIPFCG